MDQEDLAAMYGIEDTEEPRVSKTIVRAPENASRTRRINVGIIGYDVPNVAYLEVLERKIEKLEALVKDQANKLRRFEAIMSRVRHDVHKVGGAVNTVSRSMDNKLDKREL